MTTNLVGYDRLVDDIRAVLDDNVPREAEVQTKSGDWYLMRIRPYRTIDNVIEGAVITLVDITERKRMETSLREGETRFQTLVGQAYAGVAESDLAGRFTYVNDRFSAMLGYTREELLDQNMQNLTHPDDRARSALLFKTLVAGGPPFEIENRYVRKDGTALWTLTRMNSIRGSSGAAQSLIAISFDLTERKRLEEELARTDAESAKYLEAVSRLHTVATLYVGESTLPAVLDEARKGRDRAGRRRHGRPAIGRPPVREAQDRRAERVRDLVDRILERCGVSDERRQPGSREQ